jgi:hypothetical protein
MQRRNFRLLFLGTIAIIVVAFVMLRGGDRAASPPLAGARARPRRAPASPISSATSPGCASRAAR